MKTIYQSIVVDTPKLKRGIVWCKECGQSMKVDSASCLAHGWPKCCGYTMTIDSPDDYKANLPTKKGKE